MDLQISEETAVTHLTVRSRSGMVDGERRTRLAVHCPMRHASVSIDECMACDKCVGLRLEPQGGHSTLVCRIRVGHLHPAPQHPSGFVRDCTAARMAVASIMSRDVVSVPHDARIEDVAEILLDRGISGAPVIGPDATPVGIVSKTDIIRAQNRPGGAERTVEEIMVPITFALPMGESIAKAAALMSMEGVHRVVVMSPDGRIAGIVSSLDVMKWLARDAGFVMGA